MRTDYMNSEIQYFKYNFRYFNPFQDDNLSFPLISKLFIISKLFSVKNPCTMLCKIVHEIGKLNLRFSFFGLTYCFKVPAKKVLRVKIDLMNKKSNAKIKVLYVSLRRTDNCTEGGGRSVPPPLLCLYIFFGILHIR